MVILGMVTVVVLIVAVLGAILPNGINKADRQTSQSTPNSEPLKPGDPIEIVGVPWGQWQQIDLEGRPVSGVVFTQFENSSHRFLVVADSNDPAALALFSARATTITGESAQPYRINGTYQGVVTIRGGASYETIWVYGGDSIEPYE